MRNRIAGAVLIGVLSAGAAWAQAIVTNDNVPTKHLNGQPGTANTGIVITPNGTVVSRFGNHQPHDPDCDFPIEDSCQSVFVQVEKPNGFLVFGGNVLKGGGNGRQK